MSEERYRVVPATEQALSYVEHLDDKGAWCGPLILASDHPRAGELRDVDVICAACGDFCRDAPAAIVRKVRRLHAASLRCGRTCTLAVAPCEVRYGMGA